MPLVLLIRRIPSFIASPWDISTIPHLLQLSLNIDPLCQGPHQTLQVSTPPLQSIQVLPRKRRPRRRLLEHTLLPGPHAVRARRGPRVLYALCLPLLALQAGAGVGCARGARGVHGGGIRADGLWLSVDSGPRMRRDPGIGDIGDAGMWCVRDIHFSAESNLGCALGCIIP